MAQRKRREQVRRLSALSVILPIALAACSSPGSVADAEREVDTFHRQLDAGNYDTMWNQSSDAMKQVASKDQMVKLYTAVHTKLGKVAKSQTVGWQSNVTTQGSFTQVVKKTTFEKGAGDEEFVFRKDGSLLKLAGYHISSMDLLAN